MNFFNVMLLAAEEESAGGGNSWVMYIVLIVLIVGMLVFSSINNRKRQKEVNEIFDSLAVGDEIMTKGGIMGKVVALSTYENGEKLMTIETGEGDSKSTLTFVTAALHINFTKNKMRQEQLAKEKAEREAAKNNKDAKTEDLQLEEVEEDAETVAKSEEEQK
ncbi:MAG: preprotein translocase subunit YajC [Clostridia bacterium]|nr:preprotein translocase subunit YajC [Clostridia bacterium]